MPYSSTHSPFVSFLKIQPGLNLLFLLYLSTVGLYTVYSLSRALLQLRAVRNAATTAYTPVYDAALKNIATRLSNLRQFHLFSFFLFGALFSRDVYYIFNTIDAGKMTAWDLFREQVRDYADYVLVVFLGFVALHSLQWFAFARMNSVVRKQQSR